MTSTTSESGVRRDKAARTPRADVTTVRHYIIVKIMLCLKPAG
jgi:hypothetical protein